MGDKTELIGKEIRFIGDEPDNPMHGKIVAIDIHGRIITEYDELEGDVFCDTGLDKIVFDNPVKQIIEVDGRKYKLMDE